MNKKPGYSEALQEIEEIIARIENDELDVDQLTQQVKRVSFLISFCREKLRNTEDEVEKILREMEEK
jgi:exodeoxyribonuclease VII small subunit